MGFSTVADVRDAALAGKTHQAHFRKVPGAGFVTTASWWVDLSMTPGNPLPNYYASAPLVAATLDGFRGIFHGDAKAPAEKFLTELMLISPTAGFLGEFRLLDYVLYYPFVDLDDTDTQVMDNSVTLPRYTDGEGLRAMLVVTNPTTGGGSFTFDYVNQDGVQVTAPTQSYGVASANAGMLATSEVATAAGGQEFLRLANGDTGMRSVVSFTNLVSNGGLAALVLVKPLASALIAEASTPAEFSMLGPAMRPPRIYDGAFLNLICRCAASLASGTLAGRAAFAWT